MDKFYLAKTIAGNRKKEIDHDLRVRHMLKEASLGIFKVSKIRRLVMQFAPSCDRHLHTGSARPYRQRRCLKELFSRFSS